MCVNFTKHSKIFFILSFFLLANYNVLAQKTDVVILKNGDKITGEIKYLKVGILSFSTDNMETISIKWDKIKSLETKNFYEVELQDGRVYFGSLEPSEADGILVIKGVTMENKVLMSYVARINRIKESFWDILDGYLKIGFSFTKASNVGQLSLGGNAKYRTKVHYLELTLNSVLTTTNNEPTSRKQDLTFTYQRNLKLQWFGAGLASLEENTELGIKLRASLGGGIGNNLVRSNHQWLYALVGVSLNRELTTDTTGGTTNLEGLINTQYQLFKYDHPKVNLLTFIYVFPGITNWGRFRFNYNATLNWEIFIDFYWDLTFYFEYDNQPESDNSSQTDYRIDTSLKFEF